MCPWVFPIQCLVLWHNINHETQQTFIILVWGNIQHSTQADWCSSVQWMKFPFKCWNKQLYDGYCRITFLYKKVQHSSITWDSHSMNSDIMFFLSLCYFHFIFIIHSEYSWCYQQIDRWLSKKRRGLCVTTVPWLVLVLAHWINHDLCLGTINYYQCHCPQVSGATPPPLIWLKTYENVNKRVSKTDDTFPSFRPWH